MVLDNKGQAIVAWIMIGVIVFIFIVQLITPLKEMVIEQRANMDCSNSSIPTGTKAACIMMDWYTFYFIGMALAAGIGIFTKNKIAGQ